MVTNFGLYVFKKLDFIIINYDEIINNKYKNLNFIFRIKVRII